MIEFIIFFKDKESVELQLFSDGQALDALALPTRPAPVHKGGVDIHFDTMLVTGVDKILKRNRIEESSLKSVKVGGLVDESSVAYMTALAVVQALKSQ